MEIGGKLLVSCAIICILVLILQYLNVETSGVLEAPSMQNEYANNANYHVEVALQVININNNAIRVVVSNSIPLVYPSPKSFFNKRRALYERKVLSMSKNVYARIEFSSTLNAHARDSYLKLLNSTQFVLDNIILNNNQQSNEIIEINTINVHILHDNLYHHHISEHYIAIDQSDHNVVVHIYTYSISGLRYSLMTLNSLLTPVAGVIHPISLPMVIHDWSENKWRGK